ncbi:uncharacterized protein LOC134182228 [Corticium candelabrum]|uniref:uncharacterized protein LOC134182228 n=1 Tax=Corticium candelabrum TaxID=121492 RepID=UPI002E256522|nr:uncharacterized protein LOC134182228 [Corticium candelabrum]
MAAAQAVGTVNRYVFCNNKGGVGKTTLCFHAATCYAEKKLSQQNVLVVDMSPQKNLSNLLLKTMADAEFKADATVTLATDNPPRTIFGYLQQEFKLEQGGVAAGAGAGYRLYGDGLDKSENYFVVQVRRFNYQVEDNLYLLCGDLRLDNICKELESERQGSCFQWKTITFCLDKFINEFTRQHYYDKPWVVFIDTSPALALYTEMAWAAADKMIIPYNNDVFCTGALDDLFWMIYGIGNEEHYTMGDYSYDKALEECGMTIRVPRICLIINNKTTTYSEMPAKAFRLHEMKKKIKFLYKKYPGCFVQEACFERVTLDMCDFHTPGVVSLYNSCPFYKMRTSRYNFYGERLRVNTDKIKDCRVGIDALVAKL